MDDLFRFLLLRPAKPVPAEDVLELKPSFTPAGTTREAAQRKARALVDRKAHITSSHTLKYARAAQAVVSQLRAGPLSGAQVSLIVENITAHTAAQVLDDPTFAKEETQLTDSLVARSSYRIHPAATL